MTLPGRDEMVALYTVSEMRIVDIARRFGVDASWVRCELKLAGVKMPPVGRPVGWRKGPPAAAPKPEPVFRNSLEAAHERLETRIASPAPADPSARENPDLFHCLRVVRALGGRGFASG